MTFFLTDEEVAMLTDYEKPALQCRQLRKMGFSFEVGRTGKPKILREVVAKRLGGRVRREAEVNVKALSRL